MAQLIDDQGNGEGTAGKAKTVVRSTWDLLDNPEAVSDKLVKAAGKINKAKGKAVMSVWDIPYLHQYINEPTSDDSGLRDVVEDTILVVRAVTGWRSADLVGLFSDVGVTFLDAQAGGAQAGVELRLWSTKAYQNKWSPAVFIPRLHTRYSKLCVCAAIERLTKLLEGRHVQLSSVRSPTDGKTSVSARPLFVFEPSKAAVQRGELELLPLKGTTIGTYFKRAFLQNMTAADSGTTYDNLYTAHTARHAVASSLADMGVATSAISTLTLNSTGTLDSTYICPVLREWAVPQVCVRAQQYLSAKLLVPYVHWHSTGGDESKACDCKTLLVPQ